MTKKLKNMYKHKERALRSRKVMSDMAKHYPLGMLTEQKQHV